LNPECSRVGLRATLRGWAPLLPAPSTAAAVVAVVAVVAVLVTAVVVAAPVADFPGELLS